MSQGPHLTHPARKSQLEAGDPRLRQLNHWLRQCIEARSITPLVQDASFRRYFRVSTDHQSFIAMDAPPEKEPCKPFVSIGRGLRNHGVNTPIIHAEDISQGFLLLSDFGQTLYLSALSQDNCDQLYQRAMHELIKIQSCEKIDNYDIPRFDHALFTEELENFRNWYLQKHCKINLTAQEHKVIDALFEMLIQSAQTQTQVFTHRDYHSRNLMLLEHNDIGILDFQDAVWGPITYDLVSMIRDCYIVWPNPQVEKWVLAFYNMLPKQHKQNTPFALFMRWFDLMGLQRHLKAIFIFARKSLRDQDPRYLEDIPRGLHYVQLVCEKYPELSAFYQLLKKHHIIK